MISKRSLLYKQGDVWIFSLWNKCLLSNILRRNKRQLFQPHPSQNYNSITHTWQPGIGSGRGLRCVLSGSPGWAWSPPRLPEAQTQSHIWTSCKELTRFDIKEASKTRISENWALTQKQLFENKTWSSLTPVLQKQTLLQNLSNMNSSFFLKKQNTNSIKGPSEQH